MSFVEICNQFQKVDHHLRRGASTISTVSSFFRGFKKLTDTYSQALNKLTQSIEIDLPKEGTMDTSLTALLSFSSHCKKLTSYFSNLSTSLYFDIVEPLELFLDHFQSTNSEWTAKGLQTHRKLRKAKEKMNKLRGKYYQASSLAERSEFISRSEQNPQKQEKVDKQALAHRNLAIKASNFYKESVIQANECWEQYDSVMPGIMEYLQQSEESRINFIKYSLEKYTKHTQKFLSQYLISTQEVQSVVENISSDIDIRVFVDTNRSQAGLIREKFMGFQEWKQQKLKKQEESYKFQDDDYELLDESEKTSDLKLVQHILGELIPNLEPSFIQFENTQELNTQDYTKLSQLLNTPDGRGLFIFELDSRKTQNNLSSDNLMQLAAHTKSMLTALVIEQDYDIGVFIKIVELSHIFYSQDQQRMYLSSYLQHHQIWNDKTRWIQAIESIISEKVQDERECMKMIKSKRKKPGFMGAIKDLANKIPNVFIKDQNVERAEKSSANMVLGQFNFHMIHLGVSYDLASQIILTVAQKIGLDSERTCNLLAELQSNQKISMRQVDICKQSLKKRMKSKLKWNELLPIGLAVPFLQALDCFSVLVVCKDWNSKLKPAILKKWLCQWETSDTLKTKLRIYCWPEILRVRKRKIQYEAFKQKVNLDPSLIGDLSEVIDLDVARSFRNSDKISPQQLKNILKTFAFFNSQVGYCQGMNYIAGTLFINLQDEEMTFKCLQGMVEKFKMKDLFMNNLPKLKQFFYQLDRLIAIFLPEIHHVFREANIHSGHFASSWFITIFSNILQHSPKQLLALWDQFLVSGWKFIFQTSIYILTKISNELLSGGFEEIMLVFGQISTVDKQVAIFEDDFIQKIRSVQVTNALLADLEAEYDHIKHKANIK